MKKFMMAAMLMALSVGAFADVIVKTCAWTEISSINRWVIGSHPAGCMPNDPGDTNPFHNVGMEARVSMANPKNCPEGFNDIGKQILSVSSDGRTDIVSFVVGRQCLSN